MDMDWYVVYTKPDSEQKVSETLKRKKFENFCPVNSIPKKIWRYQESKRNTFV